MDYITTTKQLTKKYKNLISINKVSMMDKDHSAGKQRAGL